MLERLLVQNFQRHGKLAIDFGRITTIVGPTDAGKSAVLRALRWVCTNTPGGGAFVRHGADGCRVKLKVDGHTVVRRRLANGDENTYGMNGAEYKAFGRGVPDDIRAVLNLADINWQGQHDPAFWFSDTAGEVSRQLNAVVDLGVIDDTLGRVAGRLRDARTRLDVAEGNLAAAKAEADRWAWVPAYEHGLAEVVTFEGEAATARTRANTLARLVAEAGQRATDRDRAAQAAALGGNAVAQATAAKQLADEASQLAGIIADIRRAKALVDRTYPDFEPVRRAYKAATAARDEVYTLANLLGEAKQHLKERDEWQEKLEEAEKALPAKCPVCGATTASSPSSAATST
jgi:exonuclease SbcC